MERVSSFQSDKPKLYLVATPIGNLKDMTYRAVEILQSVDCIYAEDTRTSGVLLKHYGIDSPMKSFHKHNESSRLQALMGDLESGKSIALISDAGTPLLSDPGETLVEKVGRAGYPVVPVPGASAGLNALISSGLEVIPHLFIGFLPNKPTGRETLLKRLRWEPSTLIFYESPHRIQALMDAVRIHFDRRKVVIARELTKQFEETLRFFSDEAVDLSGLKGELVVMIDGFKKDIQLDREAWIDRIEILIEDGSKEKDAIKMVAQEQTVKKNDVYMAYQIYKQQFKNHNEE